MRVALLGALTTSLAAARVSVAQCNAWTHQAPCPPGAVAVEGKCWQLGKPVDGTGDGTSGEACDSVCGGLDAVDVEGTRVGSSSSAVVTCIEAELLGGQHIVHDFLYLEPGQKDQLVK